MLRREQPGPLRVHLRDHGFNNAVANLDLGVQLAPGIRIAVTSYASARHHQETWVKDGYFLMDATTWRCGSSTARARRS